MRSSSRANEERRVSPADRHRNPYQPTTHEQQPGASDHGTRSKGTPRSQKQRLQEGERHQGDAVARPNKGQGFHLETSDHEGAAPRLNEDASKEENGAQERHRHRLRTNRPWLSPEPSTTTQQQPLHEWGLHRHSGALAVIQPRHRRSPERSANRDLFLAGPGRSGRAKKRLGQRCRSDGAGENCHGRKKGRTVGAPAPIPAAAGHPRQRRHKPFFPIHPNRHTSKTTAPPNLAGLNHNTTAGPHQPDQPPISARTNLQALVASPAAAKPPRPDPRTKGRLQIRRRGGSSHRRRPRPVRPATAPLGTHM